MPAVIHQIVKEPVKSCRIFCAVSGKQERSGFRVLLRKRCVQPFVFHCFAEGSRRWTSIESFQIEAKLPVGQVDQIGWPLLCGLQHIIEMLVLSFRIAVLIGTEQIHHINILTIPESHIVLLRFKETFSLRERSKVFL